MRLQIALDRIPAREAVSIAAAIAPYADVIEVGTSLIKASGMSIVADVVAAAAGTPVLADLKTADDATTEFTMAYDAGAWSATVLGLVSPATVATCVRLADERDREAVVDLMGLTATQRARLAERLPGSAVLAAHVPKDVQGGSTTPADLIGEWARGRRLAVAGGLAMSDLPTMAALEQDLDLAGLRVIVGSSVTKAGDARAAAEQLAAAAVRLNETTSKETVA